MEYVAELLEGGYKAVDVSVQLGYSQPIKFSKMFQKHFGVTPRRYQMEKMR
jgi:AraC-like DNA-binding protein